MRSSVLVVTLAISAAASMAFAQASYPAGPPMATPAASQPIPDGTVAASSATVAVTPVGGASANDKAAGEVKTTVVTNGPIPDTPENRAKYASPLSNAGRKSPAVGN